MGARETEIFRGEDIPEELWACRVTQALEPKIKVGAFKEEIRISPSSSVHGKDWDSGEPTAITSTPSGEAKKLLDVYIPDGAGNLSMDAGDMLLRLREEPIDVDSTRFVPDTTTSDAMAQVTETAIGVRKRFGSTHGFRLRSYPGYVGHGTWEYDSFSSTGSNIDISEMNVLLLMACFKRTGFLAVDSPSTSLNFLGTDPTIKVDLEDEHGSTKTWYFYRKDFLEEFETLAINLKSRPVEATLATGRTEFDEDNVRKIRITIYGSSEFYTTIANSNFVVMHIEKLILGNIGVQVNTEIRDIHVDLDVLGTLSEAVLEQRFVGDGATQDFELRHPAERLLKAEVFKTGTWGSIDAELISDGEWVRFTDGPPDLDDPLRVVYSLRDVGGASTSVGREDIFHDGVILNTALETIGDENEFVDTRRYRDYGVFVRFTDIVGVSPSKIRIRAYVGSDDTKVGLSIFWDVTDISADDEILLPILGHVGKVLKVTAQNRDADPTTNYCTILTEVNLRS